MTALYRAVLRLVRPDLARLHGDEMADTARRLAADARTRGLWAWLRYWIDEFRALARAAWAERRRERTRFMFPHLLQDVRYGVRLLARTPGVTAVALLTLALGIGANTAIFSIIDGVLLRPLPYPDSDRLYLIQHRALNNPSSFGDATPGNFYDVQRGVRAFSQVAGFWTSVETAIGHGEPVRLTGVRSAGSVLGGLGTRPERGRIFTDADDVIGAPHTVVLSDRIWRHLLGGREDAVGSSLVLDGEPHTVIGVMPPGFNFPDTTIDFWAPGQLSASLRQSRTEYFMLVLGRLGDGVAPAAARDELDSIMTVLRREYPQANSNVALDPKPLRDAIVIGVRPLLWVLMGSVACVLLIACANLANLLLARATSRRREIALRQAIGAGRARLVRQLLVESAVLAVTGAIAGIVTGKLFLSGLLAWLPAGIPRLQEATIDGRVLLFTLAVTMATGMLFGLAPALQLARSAPAGVLRDNTRTTTGRAPLRTTLVIAELALALVLLAGAGLLVRSFLALQRVDPGFEAHRVLTFRLQVDGAYAKNRGRTPAERDAARVAFVRNLVDRLKAIPGAQDAAAVSTVPVAGRGSGAWFNVLATPVPPGQTPPAVPYRVITPAYFQTLGISLVRGRLLTEHDGLDGTPSVVISESTARRFWPAAGGADPVGSDIYLGAPSNKLFPRATVVGIVKDVNLGGLGSSITNAVYAVHGLMPYWSNFSFAVRTAGDPSSLVSAARQVVRDSDPTLAVTAVQSIDEIERTSIAPNRASMLLLALFAAVAMMMAAIGVFGVMSYAVNLRMREMGIRLALGARPGEVRRMVVTDGLKPALAGIALGVAGAFGLTGVLTSLLFGVAPRDPATIGTVAVLLLGTAALACYLPARRATKVDPLVVLRTE